MNNKLTFLKDIIALNLMVVTLHGQDKTLSKIVERFYWRGMVDDVEEFCKRVTIVGSTINKVLSLSVIISK